MDVVYGERLWIKRWFEKEAGTSGGALSDGAMANHALQFFIM